MTDDPKLIVEQGFDAIADRFAEWQARISDEARLRYVADLLELLPERPDVLELGPLVRRVATWLRPGGWFLATFPASENPGWRGEWLGTTMYFAGCDPATNSRLTEEAGLEVVRDELETMVEPEGEVRWQWLLARGR